jgi:LPXTG-motif cell wall-anchored protein
MNVDTGVSIMGALLPAVGALVILIAFFILGKGKKK